MVNLKFLHFYSSSFSDHRSTPLGNASFKQDKVVELNEIDLLNILGGVGCG